MLGHGFTILVNTDDAYLELGPFLTFAPITDDDIRALIKLSLELEDWDYTIDRVLEILLVVVDLDTETRYMFEVEPDDVWPTDSDSKIYKHGEAPKRRVRKEAWLERHFRAQS